MFTHFDYRSPDKLMGKHRSRKHSILINSIIVMSADFKCKDEGWIFFRSTPAVAALEVDEFVWLVD